ncbi:MAG: hypothetical protein ABIY47_01555 [Opitutaceae bacterium]
MNAMVYSIIALGFLAAWHFVYEGILAPSYRLKIRFKLFALRDRLRTLRMENPAQCGLVAFEILDESICWQMEHQHELTMPLVRASNKRYYSDPEFAKQVNERVAELNECRLNEYIEIRRGAGELFQDAAYSNSGGWLIFAVPTAFTFVFASKMAEVSGRLLGAPKSELNRMAHCAS